MNQNLKKLFEKFIQFQNFLRDQPQFYFFKCVSVKVSLTALHKPDTIAIIKIEMGVFSEIETHFSGVTNRSATPGLWLAQTTMQQFDVNCCIFYFDQGPTFALFTTL